MAVDFQTTSLWCRTLARQTNDPNDAARERLRSAFLKFRDAVKPLAGDICISMPLFTDHSIDHIDSLWETAGLVAGDDYPINPAEAFVLGGSFLLHDLGMGLVAYPEGLAGIENDPAFKDLLANADPRTEKTIAHNTALSTYLRMRHAKQAEKLVEREFTGGAVSFHLLEDPLLRAAFGRTIGLVAHSHWFNVDELQGRFGRVLGALPDFPLEWTVNPLKIACILRAADAVHIDSRRAPMYLHAYRQPQGISHDHWYFQERLTRPRVVDDRIEYTATAPFAADEAPAWWLAFDTIQMINRELQQIDALFADISNPRFQVRSVAGADSPERFASYVETDQWTPIDASLRVTQVPRVAETLGGQALYGKRPSMGLREIVSNAADATRARRIQYGGSDLPIEVRLGMEDSEWVLSIRDHGLGMTDRQLVTCLTDFGRSTWTSDERIVQFPGLLSKGFKPTGRFGIGFFAAFLLADKVRVCSLPFRGASAETQVLEFTDGLRSRPLLRRALVDEQLETGGTEVQLVLRNPPRTSLGLFETEVSPFTNSQLLALTLRDMCLLLDADLWYALDEEPLVQVVRADAWKTMEAGELFDACYLEPAIGVGPWERDMYRFYRATFVANCEDILDSDGDIVGRAALTTDTDEMVSTEIWWWPKTQASVYVGGMYSGSIFGVMGVFVGQPLSADRNSAFPVASPESLREWAERQVERSSSDLSSRPTTLLEVAQAARSFGAAAEDLPCGFIADGAIAPRELEGWLSALTEVLIISKSDVFTYNGEGGEVVMVDEFKHRRLKLPPQAIVVERYPRWIFPDEVLPEPVDRRFAPYVDRTESSWNPGWWWHKVGARGADRLILDAAARAWNQDPVSLGLSSQDMSYRQRSDDRRVLVDCFDGEGRVPIDAVRVSRLAAE